MSGSTQLKAGKKPSHGWDGTRVVLRPVGERRKPSRHEKRLAGSTPKKKG